MPPDHPSEVSLVGVREIQTPTGLDVDLTSYESVPWAEIKQAAAHLISRDGAGHILVMRPPVDLAEILAWFRAHKPIAQHPAVVGVLQAGK